MNLYALSINGMMLKNAAKNHEKIIVFDPKNEIIDRSKLTMLHELKIQKEYYEAIYAEKKKLD